MLYIYRAAKKTMNLRYFIVHDRLIDKSIGKEVQDRLKLLLPVRASFVESRHAKISKKDSRKMALTFGMCETPGCKTIASLQCPTCLKIGIQGSYFCTQVSIILYICRLTQEINILDI